MTRPSTRRLSVSVVQQAHAALRRVERYWGGPFADPQQRRDMATMNGTPGDLYDEVAAAKKKLELFLSTTFP